MVKSFKEEFLDTPLNEYVSGRLAKAAKKHGIKTVRQLIKTRTTTVQKWFGIGSRTMEELLEFKEQMTLVV